MSRPFRYTFILAVVALATGLAAVGGWRYARASAPVNGPIVLISIDALRADRLAAYGSQRVRTPAIDTLAADGVVFERAYSHVPQTLPAHASLLTGRLPFENGVRDNAGFVVKDSERLVAEILRDRGYSTGGVVSSYTLRRETGIGQGFSFFDDNLTSAPENIGTGLWRSGQDAERVAERWLGGLGTSRVFLFLHVYEPHTARLTPDADAGVDPYDAEIVRADEAVGRLIRYLKSHQLYDQSTIILVSDHGEGLGDHGENEHGLFVYEESLRVPLIVKQAAGEGAGRRVSDVVQHVDLVPTLLDFAKAPAPNGLRGRSLKPLLEGSEAFPRRLIYSESLYGHYQFGTADLTTLTDGKRRYIKAPREELYNLADDPEELTNLAGVAPLESVWRDELSRLGADGSLPVAGEIPSDVLERLEALGHVGVFGDVPRDDLAPLPDPKDALVALELRRTAVEFATARRWPEAIGALQTALRAEPRAIDLWMQLGRFYVRAGRDEQAVAAYRRVIALSPSHERARLLSATALYRLRRLDEAQQSAALVANTTEDMAAQADAHVLLAQVALARGDAARARSHAAAVVKADPSRPFSDYVEGRLLFDAGEFQAALPLFEKASAQQRPDGRPLIQGLRTYLAETLAALERDADAEREFQAEIAASPHDVHARSGLAAAYQRQGKLEEMEQTLTAMTTLTPTVEAFRAAARLWESVGDVERAAEARTAARRLATEKFIPIAQTTQQ